MSCEQAVRVSVTEYDDDAFSERERPVEIDSPKEYNRKSPSFSEDYFKLEEKRFHEAAEKVRSLFVTELENNIL